jgi:hypothetical protein
LSTSVIVSITVNNKNLGTQGLTCLLFLQDHVGQFSERTIETLQFLHEAEEDKAATLIEIRVPKNQEEKRYMGNFSELL